jgi:hypothetical protein
VNNPHVAKLIRRTGMWFCKLARRFEPSDYEREKNFVESFFRSAHWQNQLSKLTDREFLSVFLERFDMPLGTQEEAIITEVSFRLRRANGGHTDYDLSEKVVGR